MPHLHKQMSWHLPLLVFSGRILKIVIDFFDKNCTFAQINRGYEQYEEK